MPSDVPPAGPPWARMSLREGGGNTTCKAVTVKPTIFYMETHHDRFATTITWANIVPPHRRRNIYNTSICVFANITNIVIHLLVLLLLSSSLRVATDNAMVGIGADAGFANLTGRVLTPVHLAPAGGMDSVQLCPSYCHLIL